MLNDQLLIKKIVLLSPDSLVLIILAILLSKVKKKLVLEDFLVLLSYFIPDLWVYLMELFCVHGCHVVGIRMVQPSTS